MAKVNYSTPVESMSGKLSTRQANGRVIVNRRKCFGYDAKGCPFYGPNETYVFHINKGDWHPTIVNNRQLFRQAQLLAREELKDPDRLAYWQPLFQKQFKRPLPGEKRYATILGFVVAHIFAQLKKEQQAQQEQQQANQNPD